MAAAVPTPVVAWTSLPREEASARWQISGAKDLVDSAEKGKAIVSGPLLRAAGGTFSLDFFPGGQRSSGDDFCACELAWEPEDNGQKGAFARYQI